MKSAKSMERFFFAEEVPCGLALARIVLPLVLLLVMVPRWFHARELFSSDGAAAPLAINYGIPDMVPVPNGTMAVAMTTLLVLTLITSSLGWCTRLSLVIATVLYVWLNLLDCLGTLTKYSVIASHGLFLLSLSNCGKIWSIDSVLKRRAAPPGTSLPRAFPAWPRRLMQIMVGLVYIGAAFTKMHTPAFFSGDQMRQWMITNVNYANPFGEYISFYPGVLVVSAYVTIVWEVLFLFTCWKGWGRILMISGGVTFHLGTTLLLGLYIFPAVCCCIYLAFIEERDIERLRGFVQRLSQRGNRLAGSLQSFARQIPMLVPAITPRQAGSIFAAVSLITVFSGIELEHQLDPFGTRRAEGAYQLVELDPIEVETKLQLSPRIRESDKFLSFDIGSQMLGDALVNHRDTFRHGDTLIAQCVLVPPHEDMYIHCDLHDADDNVIDQVGQVVERRTLRATYAFGMFGSLQPGTYFMVIRSGGQEITRRPFTLLDSR
jgi:hypothetical protein